MGDATKTDVMILQNQVDLLRFSDSFHKEETKKMEENIHKIWDKIDEIQKMLNSLDKRLYAFVAVASLIQMVAVPVITTVIIKRFL